MSTGHGHVVLQINGEYEQMELGSQIGPKDLLHLKTP